MEPIVVDVSLYSEAAIFRAAYRFSGRAFVRMRRDGPAIEVALEPRRPTEGSEQLTKEFWNELADQRLRAIVAEETAGLRDLIMVHALSKTTLVRAEFERELPPGCERSPS